MACGSIARCTTSIMFVGLLSSPPPPPCCLGPVWLPAAEVWVCTSLPWASRLTPARLPSAPFACSLPATFRLVRGVWKGGGGEIPGWRLAQVHSLVRGCECGGSVVLPACPVCGTGRSTSMTTTDPWSVVLGRMPPLTSCTRSGWWCVAGGPMGGSCWWVVVRVGPVAPSPRAPHPPPPTPHPPRPPPLPPHPHPTAPPHPPPPPPPPPRRGG